MERAGIYIYKRHDTETLEFFTPPLPRKSWLSRAWDRLKGWLHGAY